MCVREVGGESKEGEDGLCVHPPLLFQQRRAGRVAAGLRFIPKIYLAHPSQYIESSDHPDSFSLLDRGSFDREHKLYAPPPPLSLTRQFLKKEIPRNSVLFFRCC